MINKTDNRKTKIRAHPVAMKIRLKEEDEVKATVSLSLTASSDDDEDDMSLFSPFIGGDTVGKKFPTGSKVSIRQIFFLLRIKDVTFGLTTEPGKVRLK